MAYAPNVYSDSKVPAFVTKVPHDVVLTQTDTRLFIKNIKTGITMEQFKRAMLKHGPAQVYLYEPGNKDNGWAWVGFENKETAAKIIENYEYGETDVKEKKEEINPSEEANVHTAEEAEEKQDSNSLYVENEENNDSDDENDNEQDKNDENEEDA